MASGTESALSPRSAIHTSRRRFSWDRLCFVPPSKCYRCRLAHQLPTPIMLGMNFGMTSYTQGPFIKNSSLHKDNENPETTGSSKKSDTIIFEFEARSRALPGGSWRRHVAKTTLADSGNMGVNIQTFTTHDYNTRTDSRACAHIHAHSHTSPNKFCDVEWELRNPIPCRGSNTAVLHTLSLPPSSLSLAPCLPAAVSQPAIPSSAGTVQRGICALAGHSGTQ